MPKLHLLFAALCATVLFSVQPTRAAAPAAPDYVDVAWMVNRSEFLVRWLPVVDATSYNVYRYDTNTSGWLLVATNLWFLPWNVPSLRDAASADPGAGTYSVTAVNAEGESPATAASVVPGPVWSSFSCQTDWWPRGYTFIQTDCTGDYQPGTVGMVEVSTDQTNFTHGSWNTNIQMRHVHRITNLEPGTVYYTRLTQVETNGSGWSEIHPWWGIYTLPLTPINVWEDVVNNIEIGDITWNEDLDLTPAQIVTPPLHGTLAYQDLKYRWTYTPDSNFFGTDTFTILDNPAGPPVTFTLNVQNIDDPPVAQPFTVYTGENTPVTFTPEVSDIENDPHGVWVQFGPANGYAYPDNGTNLVYVSNYGFVGTDQFEFFAYGPNFNWMGTVLATIIVTNINDAPVTDTQFFNTVEDTPVTFTVEATDIDGDPLTVEIVDPPLDGSVTNSGMTLTYTPNLNHWGNDFISFRVSDGQTNSELHWIVINISPVNDPPVANPVSVTTAEDTTVLVEFSWSDPENGVNSYAIVDPPQHGTAPGDMYIPALNYFGTDTFTYRVFDGEFYSAPATVTVTVTPVNDLPKPDEKVVFVDEDQSIADILSGTDVDGDTLTFGIISPPQHGTFANGIYTPDPNFFGTDTLRYYAFDGTTHGDNALLTIIVNPINDPPVADNKSVVTGEDTSVNIALTGVDADYDQLTFSVVTPPQHGQFIDGVYTPAANYFGPDSFTYTANDGLMASAPATVSITVTSNNDEPPAPEFVKVAWVNGNHFLVRWAPVANATGYNAYRYDTNTFGWLQIATNLQVLSVPLFRDPGTAAPVTYAVRALNSEGLGAAATGSLTPDTSAPWPFPIGAADTWKIARSYVRPSFVQSLIAGSDGMAEIRIVGSNEFFAVSWKTNLQIGHIFEFTNLAPWVVYEVQFTAVSEAGIGRSQGGQSFSFYLEPPSATLQEDTSVTINLGTQTAEVLQVLTQPSHGTLTPLQDGRWTTYTPAPNFFGTDTFQILDHTSGPPVTVTINVQNVNDAPVAQPITIYVAEDSQAMFPPVVFDIENDPYVFGVSINAAHGDSYGYQFTHLVYIPYPDFVGQDEFWYYAADESEGPPALVTVIVTNINDQPLVADQYIEGLEDTATNITLTVTDVDPGDTHTFEIVDAPAFGTLTGTAPNLTYTPNANFGGSDTFTYRVSDGQTNSALGTINLLIFGVNDTPTAQPQSISTAEDAAVPVVLSGSDGDGDYLFYIIDPYPAHGTLTLTGDPPNFEYVPDANYHGTDSFTFTTSDGHLQSGPATVSITITPVNDAPGAENLSLTTPEDTPITFTLNASDVDGDTLAVEFGTAPSYGAITNDGLSVTYTPDLNYHGADSFTYRVSDGQAASDWKSVDLLMNPINDAPTADSKSASTGEDQPVTIPLTGSDIDGDSLNFIIVTPPQHGEFAGGVYTPASNYSGPDSFTYKATDGQLYSAIATVSITITPVNDAPVADSKSAVLNEDGPVAIALTGSDVEGSALTFTVVDAPAHGTFVAGIYTPAANYNGTDSFTYKANDGQLDSVLATVSITVTAVNDAPAANAESVSTVYNTAVNIVLTGSDAEGSALTFTVVTAPANGTLTGAGANRTFTPNIGWSGTTSFTFRVNDGALDSAIATVTITVAAPTGIPSAPSALTATAVSQNQINLAWSDNSNNEDGFKIERSPNGNSGWTQIATVGPNVTTFSNAGLTKNTRYYYRVRAYNVLGNSTYSNTANARTSN